MSTEIEKPDLEVNELQEKGSQASITKSEDEI
jgi:hypothetical protein